MANTPPSCSTDSIIENETNFYNWLKTGDRTCPTPQEVHDAIKAKITPASSDASSVYYTEETLKKMQKLVEQRTNDVQVAKDRAIMSKRPELTANYYDGWFPLNRPIKHGSVPILIGFAALLFTFSIILLLELLGIKTLFTVYVPLGVFSQPGHPNQTNKPLWLMSFIALLFFAVTIYLYFSR